MEGVNLDMLGSRNTWIQGRLVLLRRALLMNLCLGGAVLWTWTLFCSSRIMGLLKEHIKKLFKRWLTWVPSLLFLPGSWWLLHAHLSRPWMLAWWRCDWWGRTSDSAPWTPLWTSLCLSVLPVKWGNVKWSEVSQSCPALCNPMDYTVRGIFQARILEWVAIPFSRGSSQPRDRTLVSLIAGRFFTSWATQVGE